MVAERHGRVRGRDVDSAVALAATGAALCRLTVASLPSSSVTVELLVITWSPDPVRSSVAPGPGAVKLLASPIDMTEALPFAVTWLLEPTSVTPLEAATVTVSPFMVFGDIAGAAHIERVPGIRRDT